MLSPWLSLEGVPDEVFPCTGTCEFPVWIATSSPGIAARSSSLLLFRFEFSAVLVFAVPGVKVR